MDFDFKIELDDPNFQEKIAARHREDFIIGFFNGLTFVFFESVVYGWVQRVLCGLVLFVPFVGGGVDWEQHPVYGPLLAWTGTTVLPISIPGLSLFATVSCRLLGKILMHAIPLFRARVADRKAALIGTILFELDSVVAVVVMLVFRLSFRLGVFLSVVIPAISYLYVPLTQFFLAVLQRSPYFVRWLVIALLKVFDRCTKWLQFEMVPRFRRFLDWVECDRLQLASDSILSYPAYRYRPLTSKGYFRVLVIERRRLFQPPKCRLEVEWLDRSPAHIACSYVWGDATPSRVISVDNCRLNITESAYNVVVHQQSFFVERRIWVDAICINQADLAEKAVQIEHMGQIYGHALWVDAYLKFDNNDSDLWILIMELLNKDVLHQAFHGSDHDLLYQPHLAPYWDQLFDLLASQWFHRMWVMQEIMLSGDLYLNYGQVRLTWPQLRSIVDAMDTTVLRGTFGLRNHFRHRRSNANDIFTPLHLVIARRILKRHKESFYTLLRFFRKQKSSDPRDKIYGLFSLASPDVRKSLGPAYQVPLRELLIRTMHYLVREEGLVCLLAIDSGRDPTLPEQIPSWVVDWNVTCPSLGHQDIPTWRAATKIKPPSYNKQSYSLTGDRLPVRMMPVIDRVGECVLLPLLGDSIRIENMEEINTQFHRWLTRAREIVLRSSPRTDPESVKHLKHAFYRTLTYDHEDPDNETILKWSHADFQSDIDFLEDWFKVGGDFATSRTMREQRRLEKMLRPVAEKTGLGMEYLKHELLGGDYQAGIFKDMKEVTLDDEENEAYDQKTRSAMQAEKQRDMERSMKIQERLRFSFNRCAGATASGRIASFPKEAREGDEICLIAGSPAPFVVRKVVSEATPISEHHENMTDVEASYQLVGWCYLHGAMDGSLAKGPWVDTYLT